MIQSWNMMNYSDDVIKNIFSKIEYPGNDKDCWKWLGYYNNKGYGNIGLFGKYHLVHRLIYQCYYGPISNICVLHHCDHSYCVKPEHLFLGTRTDNVNDMVNKNRQNTQRGSNHCNSKLNEDDVKEMMDGTISGKYNRIYDIVKSYNVSEVVIRKIFRGLLWEHVTKDFDLITLKNKIYVR